VLHYTLDVKISKYGKVDFYFQAKVREDAVWLPRLGFEFQLPDAVKEFKYFGKGPLENYCDMCHHAIVGMYESNTEKEYVNYVMPQEHGNHTGVKMLQIGNMKFLAEKPFEFNASKYSSMALTKANHTDELRADGTTHLRIDYKVSGLGSNSCGPELPEQYKLSEKEIKFNFTFCCK